MRYIFSVTGGAGVRAVRSLFDGRAMPLGRLRAPFLALLTGLLTALLLAACSGGEQAVNQPPPGSDPAAQPARELRGEGPSGTTTGQTLQGVLWNDSDGDGVFGLGDSVVGHASVVLELEGGETRTVATDSVGQYRITGLEPGAPFRLRHQVSPTASQLSTQAAPAAPAQQNVKHFVWQ